MKEEAYTNSLAAYRAKRESERLSAEYSDRLARERQNKLVQQQH
jgi:hypothetical protein